MRREGKVVTFEWRREKKLEAVIRVMTVVTAERE